MSGPSGTPTLCAAMRDFPRSGQRSHPIILVVDDDSYVHGTLAAALRGLRPTIVAAMTAAEALEAAAAEHPDLAIVDLGLPDLDGYELTRRLRHLKGLRGLRIVILSGYVPDRGAASDAGANAMLAKPFRLNEFVETVEEQLEAATA